jgi:chorismate mutase/prephenate dehydratase
VEVADGVVDLEVCVLGHDLVVLELLREADQDHREAHASQDPVVVEGIGGAQGQLLVQGDGLRMGREAGQLRPRAADGVVAIENAINGPVIPVLDRLVDTSLKVYAEIVFPISQCLLSRSARDEIKQIHSHPQALAQCQRWLRMELPGVELIPTSSTAKAAELASREEGVAAIGSSLACEIYGLNVVAEHIEDVSGNETRFMILASKYGDQTGDDKTSIVFSVKHNVGSLYDALQSFRKFGLNMTKIESRPSKNKAWEYYFFVDFEGHADDEKVKEALVDLGQHCIFLKVLGSYPKAP